MMHIFSVLKISMKHISFSFFIYLKMFSLLCRSVCVCVHLQLHLSVWHCVWIRVAVCICNGRRAHSECIPALFSGFSKAWIRLLPVDCVPRWKPAELSHWDTGTKAWWIRSAVFTSEPMSDKQSQHRPGLPGLQLLLIGSKHSRSVVQCFAPSLFLCRIEWTGIWRRCRDSVKLQMWSLYSR